MKDLLRSWKTAALLHGAIHLWAVTAPRSNISCRGCSRFKPQKVHLLRSWQMALSLHGAIHPVVVTAPQFGISSGIFNARQLEAGRSTILMTSHEHHIWLQPIEKTDALRMDKNHGSGGSGFGWGRSLFLDLESGGHWTR